MALSANAARRLGIWVPSAFVAIAELIRATVLIHLVPPYSVGIIVVLVTFVLAWLFSSVLFRELMRSFLEQQRLRGELDKLLVQEKRARELSGTLYAITRSLTSLTDVNKNLPEVLRQIQTLASATTVGLALKNPMHDELEVRTLLQCRWCKETGCRLMLPLAESVVSTGSATAMAADHPGSEGSTLRSHCRLSLVQGVPVRSKGRVFGTLMVGYRDREYLDQEEVGVLQQVADGAALALENLDLYSRVEGLAAIKERQRLARELHDSLAQSVAAIRGRAADVTDLLGDKQYADARRMMEQVQKLALAAENDVREAIWELKSSTRTQGDFNLSLQEHLQEFTRSTGVASELLVREASRIRLPLHIEAQLVRVVQEALANVRKHACATHVRVALKVRRTSLLLKITDNGRGMSRAAGTGRHSFGLQTMTERAAAIGGTLSIRSRSGWGTRIAVEVPVVLQPKEDEEETHANSAR